MGFENQKFNTSTAERVTGTIQDKIDEKKLKISQVTKENLRNLKVEILYKKSSSLRVRDSEGKVIGRLKNDQNVDFNGEIKKAHGKLFLGVNMAKNRKGFVSADYVKGEISSEETPPVALTQKKEGKTSDVKTSVKHIDELSSSEEVTEVDIEDEDSNEELNEIPEKVVIDGIEYKSLHLMSQPIYTEGNDFLPGVGQENNVESFINYIEQKEYTEKIDFINNNPQINLLFTICDIWISAAQKDIESGMGLLGLDTDDEEGLREIIKSINEKLNQIKVGEGTNNQEIIKEVFALMKKGEDVDSLENVIEDLDEVERLFHKLNDSNFDRIKSEIIYTMASGTFTEGDSKKAKSVLLEESIKSITELEESIRELLEVSSFSGINNGYFVKFGLSPEDDKDLIEILKDNTNEIRVESNKRRDEFEEIALQINPELSGEELDKLVNKMIDKSVVEGNKELLRVKFSEKYISTVTGNPYAEKFNKLDSGLYKAGEWLSDNIGMIVISLVPLGAGMSAASLIMKGGLRLLSTGKNIKYLAGLNNFANAGGILSKTAGGMTYGALTYEGMNFINNAMYQDRWSGDLLNGWNDWSEVSKMALSFGAFNLISKAVPAFRNINPNDKFNPKIFAAEMGADSLTYLGIDGSIDVFLGDKTWGEVLSELPENALAALLLGGAFSGARRIGRKSESKFKEENKKEGPEKKESLEINTTLSRYERRRFKGLIKNELKTEGNVIIQNGDTQIKIKKEQNNKYSINDGETLYTLDEVIGKIDNDSVISYLNSKTIDTILTASKDKEIVLDKSMNLPFTGKVKIKDGEIIVKKGGKDGKDIIIRDEKKVKEFLNDPKMRAEILRSFVKNMTIDDIKKRLPKDKATLEFFKALPKETINFGLENLLGVLKTAAYGGATGVILELFNNQYEGETMSENLSNLCSAFITGAALGGGVRVIWGGAKTIGFGFKKTGELLKATKDMLINKYTVGTTIAIGGTLFVFDYLDDDHSKTTN